MRRGARDVEGGDAAGAGMPDQAGTAHRLSAIQRVDSGDGLALHGQFHRALKYLTAAEGRTLAAMAEERTFAQNAVIVGMGPSRRGLYLLTSGTACMVRSHLGHDTEIAQFGAGELVGEFSYLLRSAGQTLICAVEPVEAQVINDTALSAWLASDAGLGMRFYQSLAAHVWQRRAAGAGDTAVPASAPAAPAA